MICPDCLSENTKVELVQKQQLKKGRSIWYWLTGYFIINWMMWFLFTPFKIVMRLIKGPNYKIKTREQKRLICNDCGYMGRIR